MPTKGPDDMRLLFATGAAVLLAGLMVAALLLWATGGTAKPKETREFVAGSARQIALDLESGGPYFFPDPFGHDRGVWLALEHGQIVALQQHLAGDPSCAIKWRASVRSFVDCHDDKVRSNELDRYRTRIGQGSNTRGALLLNLTVVDPAPGRTPTTSATSTVTTAG